MKLLPTAEFLDIYHETGIDVDGRLAAFKSSYEAFEYACVKYIQYAEELPGFEKFGKEDQISVLKGMMMYPLEKEYLNKMYYLTF